MMNLFHLPRLDTAKIPLVKINQRQIIISFALEVRRSLHSTSARLGIFPLQAQKWGRPFDWKNLYIKFRDFRRIGKLNILKIK